MKKISNVEEEHSRDEGETLAVPNLLVIDRVSLRLEIQTDHKQKTETRGERD